MASRTTVAAYLADAILADNNRQKVIEEAAAWLKENGKVRQSSYLVQDITHALAQNGYLFVRFTTARALANSTQAMLSNYIATSTDAKKLECEFLVDTKLIGGVLIETPYGILDASVRARLVKIVEGAYA